MTKTIKVALAGAGAFGIKHLDAHQEHRRRRGRLAGRPRARQDAGSRGEVRHRATSPPTSPTASRCSDVDAVILCTPTQMHAAQAIACLQGRQARAGRDPARRLAGRRAGGRRPAEADRPGRDVRPHAPLQPEPPVGAQRRSSAGEFNIQQMDVQTYLLPPHQHERARPAAQLDRPPAVAPRRAHGRPVRLPDAQHRS